MKVALPQNATTIDETGYRYLPVTGVSGFTLGRLEDKNSWTGAERANADVMSGSGLRAANRSTWVFDEDDLGICRPDATCSRRDNLTPDRPTTYRRTQQYTHP